MKESLTDFYNRIYLNMNTYPKEPYALVWKSKKIKDDSKSKSKPEKWDLETVRNYMRFLQEESA